MRIIMVIIFAFLSGCVTNNVRHIEGSGKWQYVTNLDGVSDASMAVLKPDDNMADGVISVLSRPKWGQKQIAFIAVFPKNGECHPVLNIDGSDYSPDLASLNDQHGMCQYIIDDSRATYITKTLLETNLITVNNIEFDTSGFSNVWPKL